MVYNGFFKKIFFIESYNEALKKERSRERFLNTDSEQEFVFKKARKRLHPVEHSSHENNFNFMIESQLPSTVTKDGEKTPTQSSRSALVEFTPPGNLISTG